MQTRYSAEAVRSSFLSNDVWARQLRAPSIYRRYDRIKGSLGLLTDGLRSSSSLMLQDSRGTKARFSTKCCINQHSDNAFGGGRPSARDRDLAAAAFRCQANEQATSVSPAIPISSITSKVPSS